MKINRLFKNLVLACLIVLAFGYDVAAQNVEVERIQKMYDEVGKKIELAEKGVEESTYAGIFSNELIMNRKDHVWPAVGNYQATYKFYYDNAGTEGHHYPDRLRKVVMTSKMSDRSYLSEYLFNEAGELVFYHTKPSEPAGATPPAIEKRVYFSGARPIRILLGESGVRRITAAHREMARKILATGVQIKTFFTTSLALPADEN